MRSWGVRQGSARAKDMAKYTVQGWEWCRVQCNTMLSLSHLTADATGEIADYVSH